MPSVIRGDDNFDSSASVVYEKIDEWVPTAVSAKQFTWDESTYQGVYITMTALQTTTDGDNLYALMGHSNGSVLVGSNYEYGYRSDYGGASNNSTESTTIPLTASGTVGIDGGRDNKFSGTITVLTPPSRYDEFTNFFLTARVLYSNGSAQDSEDLVATIGPYAGSSSYTGTAYDTVSLSWTAGTFVAGAGKITVYGIRR